MCSMHEVDRGVYYDRYVYYDMGMLAWHAAVRRYPRLAIGRLGGSRARRILDGLPTEMVASPCCREGGLRSMERAHRQEAVDGVQLCCLLAGALQAGESAGILVLSGILVWAT